jgi:hypothetical protein
VSKLNSNKKLTHKFLGVRIAIAIFLSLSFNQVLADWEKINTGINDDLTGIVFYNEYGIVSGRNGIYYSVKENNETTQWYRFNIRTNTNDSIIYNQSTFSHCYSDTYSGDNIVYACGTDTVNKQAIIIKISLPDLTSKIIYVGEKSTSLNKIGYDYVSKLFYAVGNDGLIIEINNDQCIVRSRKSGINYSSIQFFGRELIICAGNKIIKGYINDSQVSLTETTVENETFKDAINYPYDYAVGKNYNIWSNNYYTKSKDFEIDEFNANCITRIIENYIGTDHGIFKSNSSNYVLEWQPSSENHSIYAFWYLPNNISYIYACGKNGIILFTNDGGGMTKPYVSLSYRGSQCTSSILDMSAKSGSGQYYEWYVNGVNANRSGQNLSYKPTKEGIYEIKAIGANQKYKSDTAFLTIEIVNLEINKPVIIADNILCKNEPVFVNIESPQKNVSYSLVKLFTNEKFPLTQTGNSDSTEFVSTPINISGEYFITVSSNIVSCLEYFTKRQNIKVEKTKADIHVNKINVLKGENVTFFENCNDANYYKWTFSQAANIQNSFEADPTNYYTQDGKSKVKLVCWSENGCYDSTETESPMVYSKSEKPKDCWFNYKDGNSYEPDRYYNPEISQISNSKNGFYISGYNNNHTYSSQYGQNYYQEGSEDGVLLKYDQDGVVKWVTRSIKSSRELEAISSSVEDSSGNLYLIGNKKTSINGAEGYFMDNTGDSIKVTLGSYQNYIIKLDSLGKAKWSMVFNDLQSFAHLQTDKSNNLIFALQIYDSPLKIYFNEFFEHTIINNLQRYDWVILKISPEGKIIWQTRISPNEYGEVNISKVICDKSNNIYLAGNYKSDLTFYSTDNTSIKKFEYSNKHSSISFLVKYDSTGKIIWRTRSYALTKTLDSEDVVTNDIDLDNDGNIYITGSNGNYSDNSGIQYFEYPDGNATAMNAGGYYVAKFNKNGYVQWTQGSGYSYYGSGYTLSIMNNKLSVLGRLGTGYHYIPIDTVLFSSANGESVQFSVSISDYFVSTYDLNGNIENIFKTGNNEDSNAQTVSFTGMIRKDDGSFIIADNIINSYSDGYSRFGMNLPKTNNRLGIVTKFKSECGVFDQNEITNNKKILGENNYSLYPNPFQDLIRLDGFKNSKLYTIKILNQLGVTVKNISYTSEINLSDLANGMYLIQIIEKDELLFQNKIIKIK